MILTTVSTALLYYGLANSVDVQKKEDGTAYYAQPAVVSNNHTRFDNHRIVIQPASSKKFKNITRQAYDYSCGSAALTTLYNGFLGTNYTEKQVMNGLMRFGERERIVQRKAFSLLDMKRLSQALGYKSGGYKGTLDDLISVGKPVIVRISYAGFNHFVVFKGYKDGRVFIADPALGNISFVAQEFLKYWEDNTLFMVDTKQATKNLLTISEDDMRVVDDKTLNDFVFDEVLPSEYAQQRNYDTAINTITIKDADKNSDTYNQPIQQPLRLYYSRK